MDAIAVVREGDGPEVLLVHGGASPSTTWAAVAPLRARWTLALVHRRGYPPSPSPPHGRQDFDVDAADLASLFDARRSDGSSRLKGAVSGSEHEQGPGSRRLEHERRTEQMHDDLSTY